MQPGQHDRSGPVVTHCHTNSICKRERSPVGHAELVYENILEGERVGRSTLGGGKLES